MRSVYSSGSNAHGQLAHGSKEDSHSFRRCSFFGIDDEQFSRNSVTSIATGANHTLLLLRSPEGTSQLWGCGDGRRGQLGREYLRELGASSIFHRIMFSDDASRYSGCDITLIAASWESSFLVLSQSDGDLLLSTGSDDFGDLGVGGLAEGRKETGEWRPVNFSHLLPKNTSHLRITQLKSGPHNIIAKLLYRDPNMREVEIIVGWGAVRQGQLGQEYVSKKKAPPFVSSPRILDLPSRVGAFAIGNQHTVFLTSDETIIVLGSNRKNQLCGLSAVKGVRAVDATWNGTYLLQQSGGASNSWSILATGSNSNGQLALATASEASAAADQMHSINLPSDISEADTLSITCGSEHVVITSQSGAQENDGGMDIFAWGWNEHGNLGLGHTLDVHEPTRIWTSNERQTHGRVIGVWAGCATTWIVVEDI